MGKQVLPPEVEFGFDEYSLAAVSVSFVFFLQSTQMSLTTLSLESCNIVNPSPLYYLESVTTLVLKDNYIQEMDHVAQFLRTMNQLADLDLRNNPIQKVSKYRDQIVMMGLKLSKVIASFYLFRTTG